MKITVFGATGMVGKYVVATALAQGHHVVAFGRNVDRLLDADLQDDNLIAMRGYVFDEDDVYKAVKGSDAVISVLGGAIDGTDKARSLGIKNIIKQMERAGVNRIVALGGMGILQSDHGGLVMDEPGYPEEYLAVGKEHLQAYTYLKESKLNWTIIGAPDIVETTGKKYLVSSEFPSVDGTNKIGVRSLAYFMVLQTQDSEYEKQRVSISDF